MVNTRKGFSIKKHFDVRRVLTISLVLSLFVGTIVGVAMKKVHAETLDATFIVKGIKIFNSDNQEVIVQSGSTASTNIGDYPVKITPSTMSSFAILDMDINLESGKTIKAGDTISVPVVSGAVTSGFPDFVLSAMTSSNPLLDNQGRTIGTFRYQDGRINLTFNSLAAGSSNLTGLMLDFGKSLNTNSSSFDRIGKVTIGGNDFFFGINKISIRPLTSENFYSASSTDEKIQFYSWQGKDLVNELLATRGQSGEPIDLIVEMDFAGAKDVSSVQITNPKIIVTSTDDPKTSGWSGGTKYYTSSYTRINPLTNESYESFKSRVIATPLQYGIWKNEAGVKVIFYHGKIGQDTPFDSADSWVDATVDNIMSRQFFGEQDRDALESIYLSSFGNTSVINQMPLVSSIANVIYPKVIEDTYVTGSMKATYGNSVEKTATKQGMLSGMASSAMEVSAGSAILLTADADTNALIPGGIFKLQIKNSNGSYTDYTPDDGNGLERPGGDDGTLIFGNLGNGTYRVVELSAPEGYSLKQSAGYDERNGVVYSEDFTIRSTDTEGARVTIKNVKIKKYQITYMSDNYGIVTGITDETVNADTSPSGTTVGPSADYEFAYWTADKDVVLMNGDIIVSGSEITEEQIKQIVITDDITFTAHYKEVPSMTVPNTGLLGGVVGANATVPSVASFVVLGWSVFRLKFKRKKVDFNK